MSWLPSNKKMPAAMTIAHLHAPRGSHQRQAGESRRLCCRSRPSPSPGALIHQSLFSVLLFLVSQTIQNMTTEKGRGEGRTTKENGLFLFHQPAKPQINKCVPCVCTGRALCHTDQGSPDDELRDQGGGEVHGHYQIPPLTEHLLSAVSYKPQRQTLALSYPTKVAVREVAGPIPTVQRRT